jgi:hypothetical protein
MAVGFARLSQRFGPRLRVGQPKRTALPRFRQLPLRRRMFVCPSVDSEGE